MEDSDCQKQMTWHLPQDADPIFIVAMPRSGTTLMSAILSAHSNISISPETHYLDLWMKRYPDISDPSRCKEFLNAFTASKQFKDFHLDPQKFVEKIEQLAYVTHADIFALLLTAYAEDMGKVRWGEKTPGHYRFVDRIWSWYPTAKIIYMIRDPRAVVASNLKVPWGHQWVDKHAQRWLDAARIGREVSQNPNAYLIQYEALVTNTKEVLQDLCKFLDVPFEPQMMAYHQTPQQVLKLIRDQKWKNNVTEPTTDVYVSKWKRELSLWQIIVIESILEREISRPSDHAYTFASYKLVRFCFGPILRILIKAYRYFRIRTAPLLLGLGFGSRGKNLDDQEIS